MSGVCASTLPAMMHDTKGKADRVIFNIWY
jgi:hypothetical protein